MLEIHQVSKEFDQIRAVDDLSFTVETGDIYVWVTRPEWRGEDDHDPDDHADYSTR